MTLDDLRRFAVARSLFPPTTLQRALDTLGFVQADPIRAPARAQDLTLRHRVTGYRAGDLERRYSRLDVHEDFFVNYGFVTSAVQTLMHPRGGPAPWTAAPRQTACGRCSSSSARAAPVHPREVDEHFSHGTVTNYWGGSSSATTHLLDAMHYRGLLRVVRREAGIRIYGVHEHAPAARRGDARRRTSTRWSMWSSRKYAPLPAASLSYPVRRLRYAVPQWQRRAQPRAATREAPARARACRRRGLVLAGRRRTRLPPPADDSVRLLAPFDPVVWDRRRFELLWGWAYRFEAYTPVPKRKLGYYALPLLWRDRVIGWGNVSVKNGTLQSEVGYVAGAAARAGVSPGAGGRAGTPARVSRFVGGAAEGGSEDPPLRHRQTPAAAVALKACRSATPASSIAARPPSTMPARLTNGWIMPS